MFWFEAYASLEIVGYGKSHVKEKNVFLLQFVAFLTMDVSWVFLMGLMGLMGRTGLTGITGLMGRTDTAQILRRTFEVRFFVVDL